MKTTSRRTMFILIAALIGLGGFSALHVLYRSWQLFAMEDQVQANYGPMVSALYQFQHDNGHPATGLDQIVPKFMPEFPHLQGIDSLTYALIGEQNWELKLHTSNLKPNRFFIHRTTHQFTPDEQQRIAHEYHSIWTVLRE